MEAAHIMKESNSRLESSDNDFEGFSGFFTDGPAVCHRIPFLRCHWASCFSRWIAERWFDSDHPIAGACDEFCGPNAGDPALVPLVLTCKESGVFDLTDAHTLTHWLEYLSEYPARRRAWWAFEVTHGRQRALYWNNAAGRAWEALNGGEVGA